MNGLIEPPLICAFYTKDTPYEEIVLKLEESLIALGLRYKIKGYINRGCWVANCGIKPSFLLDCLNDCDEDILYVDADAIIHKVPEIECGPAIGIYYKLHKNGERELLSGTIYLKQGAIPLVEKWVEEQKKNPGVWDQKTLLTVLNKSNITPYHLAQGYCKIFDNPWEKGRSELFIEHHQASRKNKAAVSRVAELPDIVDGVRIRKTPDGAFALARKNKALEKRFDDEYIRVPHELSWLPYCIEGGLIEDLRSVFANKACYIIGKGPSLDHMVASDFKPDIPMICINESIHKIESLGLRNPIFCIQQDMSLKDTCRPKDAKLLVAYSARLHYADLDNKIVFHMEEFELKSCLTVIVAMRMVQRFGATRMTLLGFDSCVDKDIGYAKCVGTKPTQGGDPKRFLDHKRMIMKEAKIPLSFGETNE